MLPQIRGRWAPLKSQGSGLATLVHAALAERSRSKRGNHELPRYPWRNHPHKKCRTHLECQQLSQRNRPMSLSPDGVLAVRRLRLWNTLKLPQQSCIGGPLRRTRMSKRTPDLE